MSNADREMLVDYMSRALARVTTALDARDALDDVGRAHGAYADRDAWEDLGESERELLSDLGVEPDEFGEWSVDDAESLILDDLDPLSITWEKDEPFDVALSLGGPNIYLVDFGGHGGAQLRGYWGETHVMTGADVTRALEHYREEMRDIFGD